MKAIFIPTQYTGKVEFNKIELDRLPKKIGIVTTAQFMNKTEEIIKKIGIEDSLFDFFQEAKENPKKLGKFFAKDDSKKILDILNTQKQKRAIIKKEISLTTKKPDGLKIIKEILGDIGKIEVKYISAGRYSLRTESEDIKKADHELTNNLDELEKEAKKKAIEFSILKK